MLVFELIVAFALGFGAGRIHNRKRFEDQVMAEALKLVGQAKKIL